MKGKPIFLRFIMNAEKLKVLVRLAVEEKNNFSSKTKCLLK